MSKTYRDYALILKKYNIGEADSLVIMLTQQEGVVRAVAKGVRRLTSRRGGNVELFNQVDALVARGKNLDILSEVTALDTYTHWREDLERVSYAYYVADITLLLLAEGEEYATVFSQLAQYYAWLGHAKDPALLTRWYETQLLFLLGFWSPTQLNSQSHNALILLRGFPDTSAQKVASLTAAPALRTELERLVRQQLIGILDREPKSEAFVYQVRELDRKLETRS